jgi:hypothetical protein
MLQSIDLLPMRNRNYGRRERDGDTDSDICRRKEVNSNNE